MEQTALQSREKLGQDLKENQASVQGAAGRNKLFKAGQTSKPKGTQAGERTRAIMKRATAINFRCISLSLQVSKTHRRSAWWNSRPIAMDASQTKCDLP